MRFVGLFGFASLSYNLWMVLNDEIYLQDFLRE